MRTWAELELYHDKSHQMRNVRCAQLWMSLIIYLNTNDQVGIACIAISCIPLPEMTLAAKATSFHHVFRTQVIWFDIVSCWPESVSFLQIISHLDSVSSSLPLQKVCWRTKYATLPLTLCHNVLLQEVRDLFWYLHNVDLTVTFSAFLQSVHGLVSSCQFIADSFGRFYLFSSFLSLLQHMWSGL